RRVFVIYASEKPLDLPALKEDVWKQLKTRETLARATAGLTGKTGVTLHDFMAEVWARDLGREIPTFHTHRVPEGAIQAELNREKPIILTDQFTPVDNLMADVFRYR